VIPLIVAAIMSVSPSQSEDDRSYNVFRLDDQAFGLKYDEFDCKGEQADTIWCRRPQRPVGGKGDRK
jgi:hypothetical protein